MIGAVSTAEKRSVHSGDHSSPKAPAYVADSRLSTGQTLAMTPCSSDQIEKPTDLSTAVPIHGAVLIGTALASALRALCAPVLHPIADELEARNAGS